MLKSRRTFPPGGWRFFQQETGWECPPGLTFEQAVRAISTHRAANQRFKLATDIQEIAEELDFYTCARLKNNPAFCTTERMDDGLKKSSRLPLSSRLRESVGSAVAGVKRVGTGIGVLLDWLGSGAKAVDGELAESRAATCADCPLNSASDLTSFFTVPASEFIRRQLAVRADLNLSTTVDDRLGVCTGCACPLKLKVHVPIEHVLARLDAKTESALDPRCWILAEKMVDS